MLRVPSFLLSYTILSFWSLEKVVQELNFKLQLILKVLQQIHQRFLHWFSHTLTKVYMTKQNITHKLIKLDLNKK